MQKTVERFNNLSYSLKFHQNLVLNRIEQRLSSTSSSLGKHPVGQIYWPRWPDLAGGLYFGDPWSS